MTILTAPARFEEKPGRTNSGREWWQFNTRSGDVIRHHRFASEAEARQAHDKLKEAIA